jgi:hypothetical protein
MPVPTSLRPGTTPNPAPPAPPAQADLAPRAPSLALPRSRHIRRPAARLRSAATFADPRRVRRPAARSPTRGATQIRRQHAWIGRNWPKTVQAGVPIESSGDSIRERGHEPDRRARTPRSPTRGATQISRHVRRPAARLRSAASTLGSVATGPRPCRPECSLSRPVTQIGGSLADLRRDEGATKAR